MKLREKWILLNIQFYNKFNSTGIFSVEIHAFKVIRLVIKITTHVFLLFWRMKLGNNFTCVLSNFLKIIIIWTKRKWNYSPLSRVYDLIDFLLFLTWLSYRELHALKSIGHTFWLNYKLSVFWIFLTKYLLCSLVCYGFLKRLLMPF